MKKTFTYIALLFIISLSSSYSYAQKSDPLELPFSEQKPEWVEQLDWHNISKHELTINASIKKADNLLKAKPEIKAIGSKSNEPTKEEPYLMAYRRWLRAMRPYIKEDGTIDLAQKKGDSTYCK
jgi:hypothetical protein